jgi:hypothetical protein
MFPVKFVIREDIQTIIMGLCVCIRLWKLREGDVGVGVILCCVTWS